MAVVHDWRIIHHRFPSICKFDAMQSMTVGYITNLSSIEQNRPQPLTMLLAFFNLSQALKIFMNCYISCKDLATQCVNLCTCSLRESDLLSTLQNLKLKCLLRSKIHAITMWKSHLVLQLPPNSLVKFAQAFGETLNVQWIPVNTISNILLVSKKFIFGCIWMNM